MAGIERPPAMVRPVKPKSADRVALERVIRVLAEAGEDPGTLRWVQGIYDQAMALRRMARGTP